MKNNIIKFEAPKSKKRKQPVFSSPVSAGFPIYVQKDEHLEELEIVNAVAVINADTSVIFNIEGNSMQPEFNDGDAVIVDTLLHKQLPPNGLNNKMVIARLNGDFIIKTFRKTNKGILLIPSNPEYKEIMVSPYDDFEVFGVVLYTIKKRVNKV